MLQSQGNLCTLHINVHHIAHAFCVCIRICRSERICLRHDLPAACGRTAYARDKNVCRFSIFVCRIRYTAYQRVVPRAPQTRRYRYRLSVIRPQTFQDAHEPRADISRIAVAVFTDKKSRKTVIGLALGIIVIIAMPIAVFISALNMSADMDPEDLNRFVSEELTDEEKAELQTVEDMMKAIESAMTERGFTAEKTKEAQALYIFFLYEQSGDESFAEKLSACFAEDQTDEQLIAAVNSAFGTELKAEDYGKILTLIKSCE